MNKLKIVLLFLVIIIIPMTVLAKSSKDIYGLTISDKEGYVKFNGRDILGKHYIVPSNSLNNEINSGNIDNLENLQMGDFIYYLKSTLYIAKSVIVNEDSIDIELKDEFTIDDINTINTQTKVINFFKNTVLWDKDNNMTFKYTDINGDIFTSSEEDYE